MTLPILVLLSLLVLSSGADPCQAVVQCAADITYTVASQTDCNRYVICAAGQSSYMACRTGFVFDACDQACSMPPRDCWTDPSAICVCASSTNPRGCILGGRTFASPDKLLWKRSWFPPHVGYYSGSMPYTANAGYYCGECVAF